MGGRNYQVMRCAHACSGAPSSESSAGLSGKASAGASAATSTSAAGGSTATSGAEARALARFLGPIPTHPTDTVPSTTLRDAPPGAELRPGAQDAHAARVARRQRRYVTVQPIQIPTTLKLKVKICYKEDGFTKNAFNHITPHVLGYIGSLGTARGALWGRASCPRVKVDISVALCLTLLNNIELDAVTAPLPLHLLLPSHLHSCGSPSPFRIRILGLKVVSRSSPPCPCGVSPGPLRR